MTKFDLTADMIDVRDLIERVEELEEISDENITHDEVAELVALKYIMENLKGNGGDEQWRGDWYPVTLIRHSYFQDYAQELAEDIGAIDPQAKWPMNCIDWELAARELAYDYSSTDINGETYMYR